MALIAGLGNTRSEYEGTRHNIGIEIVRAVAEHLSLEWKEGNGPFLLAEGRHKGQKLLLIIPTTLMNRSGQAVLRASRLYDVLPSEILVCTDDVSLDTGTIRLRAKGGDGGHNGLADIIEKLQTNKFPRLRFGIGNDYPQGQQADYVLSSFKVEEKEQVAESVIKARDAALCFVREGIHQAMNRYNG